MTSYRLLLLSAALIFFGFGCFQVGPRIVRVPPMPPRVAEQPPVTGGAPTVIAYVKLNGGVAYVERNGSRADAQNDTELIGGDQVTVTQGTVDLVYPDAGVSQLSQGSKVMIVADSQETKPVFAELRLRAGSVWTRFERLLAPDEHFSVEANGVVATVRGTAFGVSIVNDAADVQVADHQVEVMSEQRGSPALVSAGQGILARAVDLEVMKPNDVQASVRTLTAEERARAGYLFGSQRIPQDVIKRPVKPVQLPLSAGALSPDLLRRLDVLREDAATQIRLQGFVPPTRQLLPVEQSPSGALPSLQGPTP